MKYETPRLLLSFFTTSEIREELLRREEPTEEMAAYSTPELAAEFKRRRKECTEEHQLYKHEGLLDAKWKNNELKGKDVARVETSDPAEATLVGSKLRWAPEFHSPILDIDIPAYLVPSSTLGCSHLYLHKPMRWEVYSKLLTALREADVIQEGFYRMSLMRKQSFLRYPGVHKKPGEEGSE